MERRYIYLGIGILLLLVIAYFFFIKPPEGAPEARTEKDFVEFRKKVGNAPGVMNCIGELDEDQKKIIKDSGISSEQYRQACLTQLATEGEPTVLDCRFISLVSGRMELADICYARVGTVQKSLDPCDQVFDPSTCRVRVAVDTDNCTILTEVADSDDCWQQMALKEKDPKFCDDIQESWWRDVCYMNMVRETGDVSLCKKIQDKYFNLTCR